MLAKLASGMNKPAQQTVVPLSSVKGLLESLPIKKMKQLGGKLGSSLQTDLGVNTVGDLLQFSEEKLQQRYGINTGTWLWNIARGISGEEVEGRLLPKSHGSGKTFPGPQALKTISSVQHWLNELCEDLSERLHLDLEENKRIAHTLVLHGNAYKASDSDSQKKFPSKSCPLRYGAAKIQEDVLNLFQAALREYLGLFTAKIQGSQNNQWGITSLSVSASKIVPIPSNPCCFLKNQAQDEFMQESLPLPTSGSEHFSGVNQSQLMKNSSGEDPSVKLAMPGFRRLEQKRKTVKNKGTSSILRFFKNQDPSSSPKKLEHVENTEDAKALLSVGKFSVLRLSVFNVKSFCTGPQSRSDNYLDHNQSELPKERPFEETGTSSAPSSSQFEQRRGVWSYNNDEIDPSVIDELPPEIQQEVRAWLRPHKRQNVAKRGSSIADYFLPTSL